MKYRAFFISLAIDQMRISKMKDDMINILPIAKYRKKSHGVIKDSLGLRGGRSIISKSGGLKPSAVAGKPSVTKFTQSN